MSVPPNAPQGAVQNVEPIRPSRVEDRDALWYPESLRAAERAALQSTPQRAQSGLAFSGGGVRSATFCLGVMQGLSKISRQRKDPQAVASDPLLSRFGFLSTVSGGGYFGGFLTQLFQRKLIRDAADVEAVLVDDVAQPSAGASSSDAITPGYGRHVMHWLRENGRYLAPTGSGDYLLALATVVRNWLSLQMVYATLAMLVLLAMQLLRWGLYIALPQNEATEVWQPRLQWPAQGADLLSFSPYYFLVFAMIAFAFTPIAAAYWTIPNLRPASAPWKRILFVGPGPALITALIIYLVFQRNVDGGSGGSANVWHAASLFRTAVLSLWVAMLGLHLTGAIATLSRWWLGAAWGLIIVLTAMSGMLNIGHRFGGPVLGAFISLERAIDQDFVELFLVSWAVFSFSAILIVLNEQSRITRLDGSDQSAWPRVPRHHLTKALSGLLVPIAAAFVLYLIDALGAYIYAHFSAGENLGSILTALGSGLGAAAFAPRVLEWYQRLNAGTTRARALPLNALLALFAFALFMVWAVALATIAHGLVWNFGPITTPVPQTLLAPAYAAIFLIVLASSQGFFRGFVNASSLGSIYTQRLARAYLGASNIDRFRDNIGVTEVQANDDQVTGTDARDAIVRKGAPIHLVNVCLNETLHAEMGVQQLDRKGLQLSVGPFGFCVGARHVLTTDRALPWRDEAGAYRVAEAKTSSARDEFRRRLRDRLFFPSKADESGPRLGFRPFSNAEPWELYDLFGLRVRPPNQTHPQFSFWHHIVDRYDGLKDTHRRPALDRTEVLPFSSWIGISGAAFSTGAGFRTSLPLAMLCGFFNVRLGYWWDAGVQGSGGIAAPSPQSHWLFHLFPVYGLLKTELTAAYTGTNARRWYLSDGGHFENLGLYELIRRRLKLIVSIDAGCDADSAFEDLGNLVRKARIDFATQIEFLDAVELSRCLDKVEALGTLDDLRRLNRRESSNGILGNNQTSMKHAALARIDYGHDVADADRYGWLLYIKPTVVAENLPADLAQYQIAHPDFPHQSTADQFFDEAQWESYRKLGEFTACRLFGSVGDEPGLLDRLATLSANPASLGTHKPG
ncbi:MAG: hypothetical protein SGI99_17860 [Pseudomonadota bacterium]|nr:hypothetical protein [Pseudomonadota bacterium]